MAKTNSKEIKARESKLILDLKNDIKLDKETKDDYLVLASLFITDFEKNIKRTSIELDEEYPFGIDLWKEFINYPCVRAYIQTFKDEIIGNIADKGMITGDRGAVSIKKMMNEGKSTTNNSNIILIRVPDKIDFNEE